MKGNKKWAFLGVHPHTGGTFTVFQNLRKGLLEQGVDLRWVSAGAKKAKQAMEFPEYKKYGIVIEPDEIREDLIAVALKEHLLNYDVVVVNVLCDRICTNVIRYLEQKVFRVMLVHNSTIGTYKAAASVRKYVHGVICVSPRIVDDLIQKYNFNPSVTKHIPNAIEFNKYACSMTKSFVELRILVLSRIENRSKGCFKIPKVLNELEKKNISYNCTVVGDGEDLRELKKRCRGLSIKFLGNVKSEMIPDIIKNHNIYLFPSNYEGFGLSLVEAMAGGCVPVSARLRGVTDQIIEHKRDGFLVETANIEEYVKYIIYLHENRNELNRMAQQATISIANKFSLESVASTFIKTLKNIQGMNVEVESGLNLETWSYPQGLKPGLRTYLPEPIKNCLRLYRERSVKHK
ncbi:glycosyltransferase family 4 protein [Kiritimatiellota bacterium B12222]|nr:glycosyltransferase family 4 protein [Kiritimatiellota bacterium B12222]